MIWNKYAMHMWIMHKVQIITRMNLRMTEMWMEIKCIKTMHYERWNISHTRGTQMNQISIWNIKIKW